MEVLRNPIKLIDYYTRDSIENYYMEVSDFDTYSFQIILSGQESISEFIESNNRDEIQYVLYDKVMKSISLPYFFKNKLIGDKVYLAQNASSINKAIEVYLTWVNLKYNPTYEVKDADINYSFTMYAYKNKDTIKVYSVPRENSKYNIKILAYRLFREDVEDLLEGEDFAERTLYTVLLGL
jgi:hypothetical protein